MTGQDNIDEITKARGSLYGPFHSHAHITQVIKSTFKEAFERLDERTDFEESTKSAIKEGYEMIAHKIGRAMNGDITYLDNLDDIAGYAKITARAIREDNYDKKSVDTGHDG